ncbi:developmental pluripotency-associated protein 3-like [Sorex araneus]|uniref:developmental pluripotency-associated protein 3-like n=1 Tax=Sorex araneus TaxID=42254 RepID=UPI0024338498|nr:developmental pluripotency-associated protein 3-like [Sorex araneus]
MDTSAEGNSQGNPENLIRNLRNLTLDPTIRPSSLPLDYTPPQQNQDWNIGAVRSAVTRRRRGPRTLLSVQQNLQERMLRLKKQYLRQFHLPVTRTKAFQCTCSYCRSHRQPPETSSMENPNDMDSN